MKKFLFAISLVALFNTVHGQTLPSTYTQSAVITGLNYPCDFDWTPDGRTIITCKGGQNFPAANAKVLIYSAAGTLIGTFVDLTDSVDADFERGLLGVAVDPNFATNHYVYVYY